MTDDTFTESQLHDVALRVAEYALQLGALLGANSTIAGPITVRPRDVAETS